MKFTELFSNAKFVTASKKSVNPQMRGSFYIDKVNENTGIIICGLGYFEFKINGKKVTVDLFTLQPATTTILMIVTATKASAKK